MELRVYPRTDNGRSSVACVRSVVNKYITGVNKRLTRIINGVSRVAYRCAYSESDAQGARNHGATQAMSTPSIFNKKTISQAWCASAYRATSP